MSDYAGVVSAFYGNRVVLGRWKLSRMRKTAIRLLSQKGFDWRAMELAFYAEMTPDEQTRERILRVPQADPEWHAARRHRATGSLIGGFVQGRLESVRSMLWPGFVDLSGNPHIARGKRNEDAIRDNFMASEHASHVVRVEEEGLYIPKGAPFVGTSPDGVLHCDDGTVQLLEIKCPARAAHPDIKPEYVAQLLSNMGSLLERFGRARCADNACMFVQQAGEALEHPLTVMAFEWRVAEVETLWARAARMHYDEYVPRVLLQRAGLLQAGELFPVLDLDAGLGPNVWDTEDGLIGRPMKF